jgi:hypothetical protein
LSAADDGLWVGYWFGGFSLIKNGRVRNFVDTTGTVTGFARDEHGKMFKTERDTNRPWWLRMALPLGIAFMVAVLVLLWVLAQREHLKTAGGPASAEVVMSQYDFLCKSCKRLFQRR